jgi:hypothetical protein
VCPREGLLLDPTVEVEGHHRHHMILESNNEHRLRWHASRSAPPTDAHRQTNTQDTQETQDSECTVTRDAATGIVVYSQTY